MEDTQLTALAQISRACQRENVVLHEKFRSLRIDLIMALFATFDEDDEKNDLIKLHCKFAQRKLEKIKETSLRF